MINIIEMLDFIKIEIYWDICRALASVNTLIDLITLRIVTRIITWTSKNLFCWKTHPPHPKSSIKINHSYTCIPLIWTKNWILPAKGHIKYNLLMKTLKPLLLRILSSVKDQLLTTETRSKALKMTPYNSIQTLRHSS